MEYETLISSENPLKNQQFYCLVIKFTERSFSLIRRSQYKTLAVCGFS